MKMVFVGAGVIGGSVGAWVAREHDDVYFLEQGEVAEALKEKGLRVYVDGSPADDVSVRPKVIDDLAEVPDAELAVLAVKNYSLEGVAGMVKEKLGDGPVVMSMANGIDNQRILPRHFSKVVYCVVSYNGWLDEPGVIGCQKRGPLVIGTTDNSMLETVHRIAAVFNKGVETYVTDHVQDAIHGKIALNLTNSATTLLGPDFKDTPNRTLLQKLLSGIILEGVEILKASGYRECQLGGMPSWRKVWAATRLPRLITAPLFEKGIQAMVRSSMAQDVAAGRGTQTELDSINGYMIELADKTGHRAPIIRTVTDLCKERFARQPFEPMTVEDIWEDVLKRA